MAMNDTKDIFHSEKLANKNGLEVTLLNIGAAIMRITIPCPDGGRTDLVLGYGSPEDYVDDSQFLGSTPGRYAGRIANGRFSLDGIVYELARNDSTNILHGGTPSFGHRFWQAEREANTVTYTYESPDGENGFPGALTACAAYTLNDENEIIIKYTAVSDADTVINLTNHAYFNLSGGPEPIFDHELRLNSGSFVVTDEDYNPTGELRKTAGTPLDFSAPSRLGDVIHSGHDTVQCFGGLDHCFAIDGEGLRRAAELSHPATGRTLKIDSDMPGLQVYISNMLPDGTKGRGGAIYGPYSAVCLEAQGFPDAPNHPSFPSAALRKEDVYERTVIYRFGF